MKEPPGGDQRLWALDIGSALVHWLNPTEESQDAEIIADQVFMNSTLGSDLKYMYILI